MRIFHIGDAFYHKDNPLQIAIIQFVSSFPDSFGRYFYVLQIEKNNQYVGTCTEHYEIGIHSSLNDEWVPINSSFKQIV
jgi:hypothetical protein